MSRIRVFLFFSIQVVFAQEKLRGRLEVDLVKKDSLIVVNRTTGQWVYTSIMGEFELPACPKDILVVTSPKNRATSDTVKCKFF
ncbi:hypothetical protein V8245_01305 [Flavobacterium columnare]|uniref:Uncharacterized protein n=2 Tax=Flavobacterium columnare TaxID=996 RepID=G8X599_FLACA|nr:hypothetical protein [Flavobacterium columnare]AEW85510.1 hypothetical protein FCOL_03340 [Flavobacterium columnare ATCC 49512]AMO20091.1 hypothetical protein UN65_06855 [Flavobacterium columnare]AUX18039.1 hypothetical protein AQ623_07000 [Flavobacterium columnare]MBF6656307.1 hypothetical protein [Flavobacterium columnare]MBF6659007.1 hypothetical protein [Flavobacterium columnare]